MARCNANEGDCYICKSKRDVPGNAHIQCANPDSEMTGDSYGISQGWFLYPLIFDPVWMTSKCNNFELDTEKVKAVITEE
jgi:hypothetical protein